MIIPLIAIASIVGGTFTLAWYISLDDEQREKADRIANQLAFAWFGKQLDLLTPEEAQEVVAATEEEIINQ